MVGLVCGFGGIFVSMIMEGGDPGSLAAPPAIILILIGSFGAAAGGMKLEHAIDALKALTLTFKNTASGAEDLIERLAGYADTARRSGTLALEASVPNEADPFLRRGLEMLVDGTGLTDIRHLLIMDLQSGKKVWKRRAGFYSKLGGYAPTFGIIGTVLGLIHTLEQLGGDPSELGHLIAAAFIATLFGVMFANALFLPVGNKLQAMGDEEAERRLLIIDGVTSIGEGRSPRALKEMLILHLPASERPAEKAA
jgi:chemotaxis protein MotA